MKRKRVPLAKYITEYSVRNKSNEDIPVYSVTNSQGFCTDYFDKEVASKDKKTYKVVPRGYFAYNPSRINVGSVDWQKFEEKVIVSPLYNVFSVSENMEQQYLYYFLKSDIGRQMIKTKVFGSVRDNLKIEMLKEMTIPERTVEEQKKCVSILDTLQRTISLRNKELSELNILIRARFVEMFGDIQSEEKYKNIKLKEICNTVSGGTPSTRVKEYYNGEIPWITTVSLGDNYINGVGAKAYITKSAIDNSATKLIPAGNILFGTRVGVGKSSINMVDLCTNQDIVAIIDIDTNKFDRLFIKHVLDMNQPYYDSLKKGATILGITSEDLKDTIIPNVPIEVQNKFSEFVIVIDKSKLLAISQPQIHIYKTLTLL
ncbi:MAG: restriction endonuclease subunit S [Lachnospiraceae bacterium oral taxon 082]|nr:restriction endonuclease subunit S [Lachnospiraceae bacterium oral taxon 082]